MAFLRFKCKEFSKLVSFNIGNINFIKTFSNFPIKPVFAFQYKNHFSEEDLKDKKTKKLHDY